MGRHLNGYGTQYDANGNAMPRFSPSHMQRGDNAGIALETTTPSRPRQSTYAGWGNQTQAAVENWGTVGLRQPPITQEALASAQAHITMMLDHGHIDYANVTPIDIVMQRAETSASINR